MHEIVKLRYKLMWAKSRSRNGRITLLAVGGCLLAAFATLFGKDGLEAGISGVTSGKAQLVVQVVLGGLFLESLVTTVLLGLGLNSGFTDVELRRYPMTGLERHLVRYLIGLADPLWLLVLALEMGLATGLSVSGDFNPVVVFSAVLMQFISNYLLARIVGLGIDRLVSRNAGFVFLVAMILIAATFPLVLMNAATTASAVAMKFLRWTPPFAAAQCIAHPGARSAIAFGILAIWIVGLASVVVFIESLQPAGRTKPSEHIQWDVWFDRFGGLFGSRNGPLVAFWLRFYWRNNRLRSMYALSLPVTAALTYAFGSDFGKLLFPSNNNDDNRMFLVALGSIFVVSFLAMSRFAVNQFGYLGGGFRRLLLLPLDSAATLWAGNVTSMILGGTLIPIALLLWILFGGPFDLREAIMLLGSALTGLLVQHAAALWVTLYGPRKLNYNSAGNDMSAMGNVVVMGIATCAIFAPHMLARHCPATVSPESWWAALPALSAAFSFYVFSWRATARRFANKREELLAVLEGK